MDSFFGVFREHLLRLTIGSQSSLVSEALSDIPRVFSMKKGILIDPYYESGFVITAIQAESTEIFCAPCKFT
jgi:hypothetical protein